MGNAKFSIFVLGWCHSKMIMSCEMNKNSRERDTGRGTDDHRNRGKQDATTENSQGDGLGGVQGKLVLNEYVLVGWAQLMLCMAVFKVVNLFSSSDHFCLQTAHRSYCGPSNVFSSNLQRRPDSGMGKLLPQNVWSHLSPAVPQKDQLVGKEHTGWNIRAAKDFREDLV